VSEPVVVPPGEGRTIRIGPNEITYKTRGDSMAVIEYKVGPRFVAPPVLHWHEDTDFTGIVLEGRVEFRFEHSKSEVAAGGILYVPRNTKFAWANPDDAPARVLFIYSPAGFEKYFEELDALLQANPGKTIPDLMPQIMPLWAKYRIARDE
jgi:mannose-6-phosphate isomerase-like protein (cupin superfamily)